MKNPLALKEIKERSRNYQQAHRERIKAKGLCNCGRTPRENRKTCEVCAERHKKYHNRYRDSRNAALKRYQVRNRKVLATKMRAYYNRYKMEVFNHYGAYCACCGEDYLPFLTLDHVNGDGAQHRRQLHKKDGKQGLGLGIFKHLIAKGFPPSIQVLCANCNKAKGVRPFCDCPKSAWPTLTTPDTGIEGDFVAD